MSETGIPVSAVIAEARALCTAHPFSPWVGPVEALIALLSWQDIVTAPKSTSTPLPGGQHSVKGVYLIGYCPEEGASPEACIGVIWWEPNHHALGRGAWVGDLGCEVKPTKWRPLGPAPESTS